MVPWEFRTCETTAGIAVEGSMEFQIEVIPWSGFSSKDMWLEERRIWCLPFEQEVPEGGDFFERPNLAANKDRVLEFLHTTLRNRFFELVVARTHVV